MERKRNAFLHISILFFFFLTLGPSASVLAESVLTVGNYQLVNSKRISRFEFEYTYSADITNSGTSASDVSATLEVSTPGVTVLDGELEFGEVPTGASIPSSDTFQLRLNRMNSFKQEDLNWTVRSTTPLAAPSDPEIISIGDDQNTLEVGTKLYHGRIELPVANIYGGNSLHVQGGLWGDSAPVAPDGSFAIRMNGEATALLRVVDSNGDAILMQLFPKADGLLKVNPQVDALSTAVAIVALRPGFIFSDPYLDTLFLAILETLPETTQLAERIAFEIQQGAFTLGDNYSPEVNSAILTVLNRVATLSADEFLASTSLESSSFHRFVSHLKGLAAFLVKDAQADTAFVEDCNDIFSVNFKGRPGTDDDVCFSAVLLNAGKTSEFQALNRRTRWVFFGDLSDSDFDTFALLSPRHVSVPGVTDTIIGIGELVVDSFIDTAENIGLLFTGNFEEFFFPEGGRTSARLQKSFDERFGASQSLISHTFMESGVYSLGTLGVANQMPVINPELKSYWAGSFILTLGTEAAIPIASVFLDVFDRGLFGSIPGISYCVANNLEFLNSQTFAVSKLIGTVQDGSNSEIALGIATYLVEDILLEENAWRFLACTFEDLKLLFSVEEALGIISRNIAEFGGPVGYINKISSGAEAAANLALFGTTIFSNDLVSEDFYEATIGATIGPIAPLPTVSLQAKPEYILLGESTTLTWTSTDASWGCWFYVNDYNLHTGSEIDPQPTGSIEFSPTKSDFFSLACSGPGGTSVDDTYIEVMEHPVQKVSIDFEISPSDFAEAKVLFFGLTQSSEQIDSTSTRGSLYDGDEWLSSVAMVWGGGGASAFDFYSSECKNAAGEDLMIGSVGNTVDFSIYADKDEPINGRIEVDSEVPFEFDADSVRVAWSTTCDGMISSRVEVISIRVNGLPVWPPVPID